jgi:hypothetical protein
MAPQTSYTYLDTDWIASLSEEQTHDPSTNQAIDTHLVDYGYDNAWCGYEVQFPYSVPPRFLRVVPR